MIRSMTGFASVEAALMHPAASAEEPKPKYRLEIKALNHRHLDIKLRLPRDLSSAEPPLRALVQGRFNRGALDLKLERISDGSGDNRASDGTAPPAIQVNLALAAHYYESLVRLQKTLGLSDPIRTSDIAAMPDVFARAAADEAIPDAWPMIQPLVQTAMQKLEEMRAEEGASLGRILRTTLSELDEGIEGLRGKRKVMADSYREKIQARVKTAFESYPALTSPSLETAVQTALEARVAQELALLLDRTDIEEELSRFKSHLDHFEKVLDAGGPVGRKLDFILQELNREINTLGNKAQDFGVSEETIQIKVRIEQMREQVMNLE